MVFFPSVFTFINSSVRLVNGRNCLKHKHSIMPYKTKVLSLYKHETHATYHHFSKGFIQENNQYSTDSLLLINLKIVL